MKYAIFGGVVGVALAMAGTNIVDDTLKFLALAICVMTVFCLLEGRE